MKTTMSDPVGLNQQCSYIPSADLVASLGSRAFEEAVVVLAFDQGGKPPDLARAEATARAVIEMGGLLMASVMALKGRGSLAESREKIKAAWSKAIQQKLGDRMLEIAARSL